MPSRRMGRCSRHPASKIRRRNSTPRQYHQVGRFLGISEERLARRAISALERLGGLHARVCPRQMLGVRIGQRAGELLGVALPRSDKLMLAIVEIDGCFADGVSVATGCWLGRRTLRFVDHGKVAATFIDLQTCRAVRIWPNPQARVLAEQYVPDAADRWHAQLEGYRVMPATELLASRSVTIKMPSSSFLNADSERVTCGACGEEIMNRRQVIRDGLVVCRACAGPSYLEPTVRLSPTGSLSIGPRA